MTRARDIADLVDANGDIVAGALDNVPAADLVNDTTPQLGGTLDAQGENITNVANFGVGTSSPSQRIHVEGPGNQFIYLNNSTTSDSLYLKAGAGASSIQTGGGSHLMNFFTNGTERMKINSSGYVTTPYQVAFSATPNGSSYTTTSPIQFGTVNFNVGNAFNASNYTFTAPVAGTYLFHLHLGIVRLNSSSASGYPRFQINNGNVNYAYVSGPAALYVNANMTMVRVLSANDTVKVVYQGSNSNYYDGANECRFMGYLLG